MPAYDTREPPASEPSEVHEPTRALGTVLLVLVPELGQGGVLAEQSRQGGDIAVLMKLVQGRDEPACELAHDLSLVDVECADVTFLRTG